MAVSSGTLYESFRFLQHTYAFHPVRVAIVGLDFFAFNAYWHQTTDFREDRLAVDSDDQPTGGNKTVDVWSTLLSWSALKDSLATILQQQNNIYTNFGQLSGSHMRSMIKANKTQHDLFLQTEKNFTAHNLLPAPFHAFRLSLDNGSMSTSMKALRSLVHFCLKKGIDLKLFIPPMHARYMEMLRALHLSDTFEQWKRNMIFQIVADVSDRPEKTLVSLWDFSGYNSITTESLPGMNDKKSEMKWYWESSHFKAKTGDLILSRMFNIFNPDLPDNFGVLITAKNIEQHLRHIRSMGVLYRQQHPNDVREVENNAKKYLNYLKKIKHHAL